MKISLGLLCPSSPVHLGVVNYRGHDSEYAWPENQKYGNADSCITMCSNKIAFLLMAIPAAVLLILGLIASVSVMQISITLLFALPFVAVVLITRRKMVLGASLGIGFTSPLVLLGWYLIGMPPNYDSVTQGIVLLILSVPWALGAGMLLKHSMKIAPV